MDALPAGSRVTPVPWQSLGTAGLADLGLSKRDVVEAAWWIDVEGRRWRGHLAIAQALIASAGWRRVVGRIIMLRLVRPPAALAYWLVARYRRHLPVPSSRSWPSR